MTLCGAVLVIGEAHTLSFERTEDGVKLILRALRANEKNAWPVVDERLMTRQQICEVARTLKELAR